MREIAPNITGGLCLAVNAYEKRGEALAVGASLISETAIIPRLLIISNNEINKPLPVIDKQIVNASKVIKRTINRKQITRGDTFTHGDVTYRINNGKGKVKLGLYVETLRSIAEQFQIALESWRRVFVLRVELHQSYKSDNSEAVAKFIKGLGQKLKREYGFKQIGYCWAREYHGKGKGQHYHFALFLDGNRIRHSSRINEIIRKAWQRPTGGYTIGKIKRPQEWN